MFRAKKGEDLASCAANGVEVTLGKQKHLEAVYPDEPITVKHKPSHFNDLDFPGEVHKNVVMSSRDSRYQDFEIVSEKRSRTKSHNFVSAPSSGSGAASSLDRRMRAKLKAEQNLHYYSPQVTRSRMFDHDLLTSSSSDVTLHKHLHRQHFANASAQNSSGSRTPDRSRRGSPLVPSKDNESPSGSFSYAIASSPRWLRRSEMLGTGQSNLLHS